MQSQPIQSSLKPLSRLRKEKTLKRDEKRDLAIDFNAHRIELANNLYDIQFDLCDHYREF
jgi:hypothetical protein